MPLYEYECLSCGRRSEALQRMDDPKLTICPDCGGPLKKLVSASGFQLKGSGWYATDYARQKGGGAAKAEGAAKESAGGGEKPAAPPAKEGESAKPAADASSKPASS
jgi:putative FmdB family regulatory protein